MSKSKSPDAGPAESAAAPQWVVLLLPFTAGAGEATETVPAGRCVLLPGLAAQDAIAAHAARAATETDLSIGASLARDLTPKE